MLSYLAGLEDLFGPLRLFGYTSSRVVFAALTAFVLMMLLMPVLIRLLRRLKFGEQGTKDQGAIVVDNMRQAKAGTPTMGGLGIIASIFVAALLWCDPLEPRVFLLILGLLSFGLIGYLDDRTKVMKDARGIRPSVKLLLQLLLGGACGLWFWHIDYSYQIVDITYGVVDGELMTTVHRSAPIWHHLILPFVALEHAVPLGLLVIPWVLVMTFSCSNAVNFTDGLDGLSAGTMLIACLAFLVIAYLAGNFNAAHYLRIAYIPGSEEVAVFCAGIAGSCIGFLWFNSEPAEVFMGDTGSQSLGAVLALVALCTKQEFLILLVGFVFFMEAVSVLLQVASYRLRGGKRIFLCAPIHHHFQYKGWPESKIVIRFWMIAALTAMLALATLKVR